MGAYDDGRSAEELEKSIVWDQPGNVQFLRDKYKVLKHTAKLKVPS